MFHRVFYVIVIFLFLIAGLYINFILQKDFLNQLGFASAFIVVTIIFFDGAKILSEVLFFRLKGFAKISIGIFAIALFMVSVYSTFAVRNWKAKIAYQKVENVNVANREVNTEVQDDKNRLNDQIASLEKQMSIKQSMIASLDARKDKWLILRYNKEMEKLNTQKLTLIKEVSELKDHKVPATEVHQMTLTHANAELLGASSETLEAMTNLVIAFIVDGIILFLCYNLSYVLGQKVPKTDSNSSIFDTVERETVKVAKTQKPAVQQNQMESLTKKQIAPQNGQKNQQIAQGKVPQSLSRAKGDPEEHPLL